MDYDISFYLLKKFSFFHVWEICFKIKMSGLKNELYSFTPWPNPKLHPKYYFENGNNGGSRVNGQKDCYELGLGKSLESFHS